MRAAPAARPAPAPHRRMHRPLHRPAPVARQCRPDAGRADAATGNCAARRPAADCTVSSAAGGRPPDSPAPQIEPQPRATPPRRRAVSNSVNERRANARGRSSNRTRRKRRSNSEQYPGASTPLSGNDNRARPYPPSSTGTPPRHQSRGVRMLGDRTPNDARPIANRGSAPRANFAPRNPNFVAVPAARGRRRRQRGALHCAIRPLPMRVRTANSRAFARAVFSGRSAAAPSRVRWARSLGTAVHRASGWVGTVFWPYAYNDFVDYTLLCLRPMTRSGRTPMTTSIEGIFGTSAYGSYANVPSGRRRAAAPAATGGVGASLHGASVRPDRLADRADRAVGSAGRRPARRPRRPQANGRASRRASCSRPARPTCRATPTGRLEAMRAAARGHAGRPWQTVRPALDDVLWLAERRAEGAFQHSPSRR